MADDLDLLGADHIAEEADEIERRSRSDQRRGNREDGISGAHRIDDFRGRYRIWLAAAMACLVLSANSIAGLHEVLADVMTRVTGWSALRGTQTTHRGWG